MFLFLECIGYLHQNFVALPKRKVVEIISLRIGQLLVPLTTIDVKQIELNK